MALIICVECGKSISDKSEICPNCGCPTKESIKEIEKKKFKENYFYSCPICRKEYPNGTLECDVCKYIVPEISRTQPSKASNIPKCPTCGSTNVQKISSTERAVSVLGLGIMSKKIGKSYKCLNCKYTW